MTHTPGPWSCDYGDFAAYCQTGAEVCEVTKGNHDDGTKISDDEMEANLRLVAAAPELLAALKAHLPWHTEPEQGWGAWADAVEAIRKAEGRNDEE